MCGIAGYFGAKAPSEEQRQRALDTLRRRGPDSNGQFFRQTDSHACSLLFSRLAIIDLDDRSNQPFRSGPFVLVFNGEIYNYRELRTALEAKGRRFVTESDTEVLLQSFEEYGSRCVEHFEGMWAFAAYDTRNGEMFLSRDRFGEKPFYFHRSGDGFFFASEVKALRALSGVKFSPNFRQINRYLLNGYRSLYKTEETFFEDVFELQPGQNCHLSPDKPPRFERYWLPRFSPKPLSFDQSAALVKEKLLEAVRIRLRADVPMAFCLSGGVDSSALVSIAAKVFGHHANTYSIVDQDERYDERANIDVTVKDIGSTHKYIYLERETNFDYFRNLTAYHDAPIYTISYLIHSYISREVSADGYRVSFSGTGADELVSGYYDHFHFHLFEMRNHPNYARFLSDWRTGIGKSVRNPFLKDPELIVKNPGFREHIFYSPTEFEGLIRADKAEPFTESKYSDDLLRNRMMNEMFHEGTRLILHEDDLNSMYYSIENRSPYLDRGLFEACYSIPTEHLIRNGTGKVLLREAMAGILNDQTRLDKVKRGFNASILSIIDFNSPRVKEELLSDSPVFEFVDRREIEKQFSKPEMENSLSKFLFSFVSTKLFLESLK